MNRHKIFTKFLEDVVDDKVEDNKEFEDIDSLKNRFNNLRQENQRLLEQKSKIERDVDETRRLEQERIQELQKDLYEMQTKMQSLQQNLESISSQNIKMEQ